MAPPPCCRFLPSLLLFLLLLLLPSTRASSSSSFSLAFFPGAGAAAQLALSPGANATSGAVSLASPGARVQYRSPILLPALAFSTYFSFALLPDPAAAPGDLAFFLTPAAAFPSRSAPALAVAFSARHIRVDLAGRTALQVQAQSRPTAARLHAWVDYNATSATLHVRLSAARPPTPPLLSYPLDLSPVLRRGPVLAGFRTSSGNCSLFSWAFRAAPYRMHSQPLNPADLLTTTTPPPPPPPAAPAGTSHSFSSPWGAAASLLFAAACGAMLTFLLLFLWYSVAPRRPVAPLDHPSGVVYEKIVLVGVKDDAAAPAADDHVSK